MNPSDVTLSDVSVALRRQFRTIALIVGPVLAIAVGIGLGLPDAYRSAGVIRIEQLGQENRAVDTYAEYYVETLAGQVLTPAKLKGWVEEFDLFAAETWGIDEKVVELRDTLGTEIVMTPVIDPISGRERDVVTGFLVFYDSPSPEQARDVAMAATEAFLAENRRLRQLRGEGEIEFFRNEADLYRKQIAEVEERLAQFKERNSRRLPELVQINMAAMDRIERDLETTQLQIDTLKRERTIVQSQLSAIPSTSNEAIAQLAALQNEYVRVSSIYQENHPNVVSIRRQIELLSETVDSSAAIPILQQQLNEITVDLAQARERYSEDHPDVRQLVRSEAALKGRIATLAEGPGTGGPDVVSTNDLYVQLNTQVKSIDTQLAGLEARIVDLRLKRDEYQALLLETPQVEREQQELERDLTNARALYEETQAKQRGAELALALQQGAQGEQLVLAQPPGVPDSPAWPPRAAIIVLGLIVAVGMGVGVATLRESTSAAVRSSRDATALCGAPPIALIPTMYNHATRTSHRLQLAGFAIGMVVIAMMAYAGALRL
jgi:uncharacterized protein involved in exopolysaccharide biosynthesis